MVFFICFSIFMTINFLIALVMVHSGHNKIVRLESQLASAKGQINHTPRPECLCGHGINFHDENGGRCGVDVREVYALPFSNLMRGVRCACKRYTGPEPLPEFYHPLEIGN